jgi:integrase
MKTRLTDGIACSLKLPRGKTDLIAFDNQRPGLGVRVRVMAGGVVNRTWVVQLRVAGRSQRHDLGPVTATPTMRARELADDIFAKARQGIDPAAEKRNASAKAAEVFEPLAADYLKAAKKRLRQRSYDEVKRHLETHCAPLNRKPIHEIDRKMVADRLKKIAEASGAVSANRVRASLSAMFTWAIKQGLAEQNPVAGTEKQKEAARDRVLSAAEIAAVWRACGDDDYGRIVRLLILTGQRRDEVGGILESELQRDLRLWSLPAERTKNALPHDVPLSAASLALLPEFSDERQWIFASRGKQNRQGPFSGWSHSKAELDKRVKAAAADGRALAPWTLHDLRRSAATGMAEIGVQPHIIEAALNHISGARRGVAGIYNRAQYADEKRDALKRWAEHVQAIVAGAAPKVIPIRATGAKP